MENLASRIESAELSDSALDNVSGGLGLGAFAGVHLETPVADVCADVLAVASADGVVSAASVHVAAL
ncbi:hypothetical protein [Streptomyces sp. NPDC003247]|uniref:hypothetical protein n=1 Tax=Streptomyces sp. NPDC003247 TaxID=3364677 RepID=UPI0036A1F570